MHLQAGNIGLRGRSELHNGSCDRRSEVGFSELYLLIGSVLAQGIPGPWAVHRRCLLRRHALPEAHQTTRRQPTGEGETGSCDSRWMPASGKP